MKKTVVGLAVFATLMLTTMAEPKATWVKKAQAQDPAVTSCLGCHTAVKGLTAQQPKLSPRGEFLMKKKEETKAPDIDFAWLKDYKDPETKK